MKNNQTKIFFCDFDGTLGTSEKNISPRTREVLDRFAAEGNIFVLSSGRAMSDVKNLAKRLDLHYPNMFLSAYNGAEVCSWSSAPVTFYRETIPFSVVSAVFHLARQYGLYCQTYDGDEIVVPARAPETDYYTKYVKMPVRVEPAVSDHPEKVLKSGEPSKCLVILLDNPDTHRIEPFAKELENRFGASAESREQPCAGSDTRFPEHAPAAVLRTVMSNPYYLEIDPINATKAHSLLWLCRYLGIDPKNSIAAGDAPNDNPMLRAAGIGIGMINGLPSNPDMKEAAGIITTADNDHDGLAEVLDKLF